MIDESSTLDEIIMRTIELRKLQQALRGDDTSEQADDVVTHWTSYRYGLRQGRRR